MKASLASLVLPVALLCGCAPWNGGQQQYGASSWFSDAGRNTVAQRPASASTDVGLSWAYRVEGNQAIRPTQVFQYRGATYLLMRPGQEIPAVVVNGRVARFDVWPPYLIVRGAPSRIDLISRGYRVIIQKEQS